MFTERSTRWGTGGLATGLRGPHERSGGFWIGWPGDQDALSNEDVFELPPGAYHGEYAPMLDGYALAPEQFARDLVVVADAGVTPAYFQDYDHREAFKYILEHHSSEFPA